jgi:hypothetical protein
MCRFYSAIDSLIALLDGKSLERELGVEPLWTARFAMRLMK